VSQTVMFPARFNGPPGSANGGYACGVVAQQVPADRFEVTLRSPPPLDTALGVERAAERCEPCIVVASSRWHDGRKIDAHSTLYTSDGQLLAAARAVWIDVAPGVSPRFA